ncbi:MAG: DUF4159 domain-containing protein [Planctomycetota bacterium]|jgi:hypothetical protein
MMFFRVTVLGTEIDLATVDWLLDQQADSGGWGFGPDHPHTVDHPDWTDVINTQLAIAALRWVADADVDIPESVFDQAAAYCLSLQNADGGWGYTPADLKPFRVRGASHGSATAAALAILADCPLPADPEGRKQRLEAVGRGAAWLAGQVSFDRTPGWVWGADRQLHYYLFCLSRLTTRGFRSLGPAVIRDGVVGHLLSTQQADGRWAAEGNAAMAQLCGALALAEAQVPMLIGLLSVDEFGPAETAAWVADISRRAGRRYGWQRVALGEFGALTETPIVVAAHTKPLVTPGPWGAAVQAFVNDSGTLVAIAGEDSADVLTEALSAHLNGYWRVLEDAYDLSVFGAVTRVPAEGALADVVVLGDGCQPGAVILSAEAFRWVVIDDEDGRTARAFLTNVAVAATGINPPLGRGPFESSAAAEAPRAPRMFNVARIVHDEDWATGRGAFEGLSDRLAGALSIGVRELPPVTIGGNGLPEALLWLTGTRAVQLSPEAQQALKQHIVGGGTLFIDSAMGRDSFNRSVDSLLNSTFGVGLLKPIPADHPLITGQFAGGMGSDLTEVGFTFEVTESIPAAGLSGLWINGRLAVIVSRYGVTPALARTPAFGARALLPADAERLVANVLLYVANNPPMD